MSKNQKSEAGKAKEFKEPRLHHETKKSIAAVLMFGLAVILLLARFRQAGPVGDFVYNILDKLFGWGYWLWPVMAVLVALVFLMGREEQFLSVTFLGALAAVFWGLGVVDLIFPQQGGLIGRFIGLLEIPFGYPAALLINGVLLAAALLVTLNAKIRIFEPDKETKGEAPLLVSTPEGARPIEEIKPAPAETAADKEEKIKEDKTGLLKFLPKKTALKFKNYLPPPLSLLKSSTEKPTAGDLRANANIIKRTLESFGIPVEMGEISIGPKVTRYTLKPAEGVKLTRITALNQDLSLALAAHPIRIEAPIPGKSLVGIEVPNKTAAIVRLGGILAYPEFSGSGPLSFFLGRDVTGEPILTDIEKMPHLLISGSTGSGKSITAHAIIISLLYKNSPETLKLVLIDPKRVELSVYDDLPHLIAPVITEGKKAIGVFRWAIQEMEKRYETLLHAGSRDIKSYNNNRGKKEPLPYLLIIVDELADLMAAYGREIETSVVRLAQMARATGIHLIVSTQRPSVEVITGLIKANITSRIALQVASQIDSRTILDAAGAEKLLGGGDMLFISSEFSKPKRIQGAYVSEEEIRSVADFIRDNNQPAETEAAVDLEKRPTAATFTELAEDNGDDDELYEEAVATVSIAKKASASLLQRRLKVGYARAARLLDLMEAKGIIGPGEGAKPREVYLDQEV